MAQPPAMHLARRLMGACVEQPAAAQGSWRHPSGAADVPSPQGTGYLPFPGPVYFPCSGYCVMIQVPAAGTPSQPAAPLAGPGGAPSVGPYVPAVPTNWSNPPPPPQPQQQRSSLPASSHSSPEQGAATPHYPLPISLEQQCPTDLEPGRRQSDGSTEGPPGASRASSRADLEVVSSSGASSTCTCPAMTSMPTTMQTISDLPQRPATDGSNEWSERARNRASTWPYARGEAQGQRRQRRRRNHRHTWSRERSEQAEERQQRSRQAEHARDLILQEKGEAKRDLESGWPQARIKQLHNVKGCVWLLSLHPDGSVIVQLALQNARRDDARMELCKEFHGRVRVAVNDKHANYVIQTIVETIPVNISGFIAEELSGGIAAGVCKHKHGCRVMCKLIEHFRGQPCMARIEQELRPGEIIGSLVRHSFGRRVMEAILKYGSSLWKRAVVYELATDIHLFSKCRHGSYVVEAALVHCCPADVVVLLARVLNEGLAQRMLEEQFGIYVIRTLMSLRGKHRLAELIALEVENTLADQNNAHYERLMRISREGGRER